MSKNRKIKETSISPSSDRTREIFGIVGLGASLFVLFAMISLQLHTQLMGPFGRSIAASFYGLGGTCGYLGISIAIVASIRMLLAREPVVPLPIALGALLATLALAVLAHLA